MKKTICCNSKNSEETVFAGLEDMARLQKGLAQNFNTQGRLRKIWRNWGQNKASSPRFYRNRSLKALFFFSSNLCRLGI